jgi:hypothetical protein
MKFKKMKINPIEIINGVTCYNLAASATNDDWLRAARLLKEGKMEELQNLNDEPMYCYQDLEKSTKSNTIKKGNAERIN